MKVMVVDDEKDIEILFRQKFRKEIREGTIDFIFKFSGEEAIEYLNDRDQIDTVLILSDINMPGMNGLELLKIIKENYDKITVFMITAYGDDNNYQTALKYGADAFITKPINFSDLKDQVFEFLSDKGNL